MRDLFSQCAYVRTHVRVRHASGMSGLERACHASGMAIRTLARMRARTWIIRGSPSLVPRPFPLRARARNNWWVEKKRGKGSGESSRPSTATGM